MKKVVFIIVGTISVALGLIGIIIPLLPTTPLLLLAAACFARSSPKFHSWLFHNPWFGTYLTNYKEGRGIPSKIKVYSIVFLWCVVGLWIVFADVSQIFQIILIVIGMAVTVHLMLLR